MLGFVTVHSSLIVAAFSCLVFAALAGRGPAVPLGQRLRQELGFDAQTHSSALQVG